MKKFINEWFRDSNGSLNFTDLYGFIVWCILMFVTFATVALMFFSMITGWTF